MNPAQVRESWRQEEYLQALTEAWVLTPNFYYRHIYEAGNPGNPDHRLDLRNIVFKGCHHAVAEVAGRLGKREDTKRVIDDMLKRPVPNSLVDHGGMELNDPWCEQYRKQMILAHLLCARTAVDLIAVPERGCDVLNGVNVELEQRGVGPLPLAFLDDLITQLLDGERSRGRAFEAWFPLVNVSVKQDEAALIAKFVLELLPGGTGEVFIAVEQAFVPMDDDFIQVFHDAPLLLKKQELCSPSVNVRVRVEHTVHTALIRTPLVGSSGGGAMALGLWSAWTGRPLPEGLIASFALRSSRESIPDGRCHPILFESEKLNAVANDARRSGRKTTFLIADGQRSTFTRATRVDIRESSELRAAIALVKADSLFKPPPPDLGLVEGTGHRTLPATDVTASFRCFDLGMTWGLDRGGFIGLVLGAENDGIYEGLARAERAVWDALLKHPLRDQIPVRYWVRVQELANYPDGPDSVSTLWQTVKPKDSLQIRYLMQTSDPLETIGIFLEVNAAKSGDASTAIKWCRQLLLKIFFRQPIAIVIHIFGCSPHEEDAAMTLLRKELDTSFNRLIKWYTRSSR